MGAGATGKGTGESARNHSLDTGITPSAITCTTAGQLLGRELACSPSTQRSNPLGTSTGRRAARSVGKAAYARASDPPSTATPTGQTHEHPTPRDSRKRSRGHETT